MCYLIKNRLGLCIEAMMLYLALYVSVFINPLQVLLSISGLVAEPQMMLDRVVHPK